MSDSTWLKEQLEKMDVKLDKIDSRVDNLDITSVKQQAILEEHHKRSLANEAAVAILKEELTPVKEHVLKVNFIIKVVLWFIVSASALEIFIHKLIAIF